MASHFLSFLYLSFLEYHFRPVCSFSMLCYLSFKAFVVKATVIVKTSASCAKFPIDSKFHFSHWKTYFSPFIDKVLKFEEIYYLIHYIKYKMRLALFYVNSMPPPPFPNSSLDSKLGFSNVDHKLIFYIVVKSFMIIKNSVMEIQNLAVIHESRPIKSNSEVN